MHIEKTVFENHKDSYYKDCGMKWWRAAHA